MVALHDDELESFMTKAWREYSMAVIPNLKPGDAQYDDMQATFYAGALHILDLCEALGEYSEEFANEVLSETHADVERFFAKKRSHL